MVVRRRTMPLVAVGLALCVVAPAAAGAAERGFVLNLGGGLAVPSHFDASILPYARIGAEYDLSERYGVELRGTVASDGTYIVGNPMFAFHMKLSGPLRAALMAGYGNFSKFHGGYLDEGWASDGFSWGLGLGYRLWIGDGVCVEPEMYYSSTSLTSHQTGIGSTGTFVGLGVVVGIDL